MEAWSKIFSFVDPFPYQKAIRAADLEVLPTTKGSFHAELTQICLDRLWMQRARESLPRICVGAIRPGRRVIGFLTDANLPAIRHRGMEVGYGDIIVNTEDLMHRQTESKCDWGSMSLTLDDFDAAYQAIVGAEFPAMPLRHLVRPSSALMSRLLNVHERVGRMARTNPDAVASSEAARALEQELIHLMIRCLSEGVPLKRTAGAHRRDRILALFEDYLAANGGRALYLPEVCAAIGVAERTLRGACEEHFGMGPIRYLTLRRMHLVRRVLLRSDPSETSVTRVATNHGFWELGRFSVIYRTLFGEMPSESLRKPPNQHRIFVGRPLSATGSYLN